MAGVSGMRALLEEEETDTFCVSCIENGYLKTAETFCVKCDSYLCNRCVKKHQSEKSLKEQELLDKEREHEIQASSDGIAKTSDECVERCAVHVRHVMEYYCERHQKLCCTACIALEHTTCLKTYIPTASENVFKSQVYRKFKSDIQEFIKNSTDNQKKLDKAFEKTRIDAFDILDDIRRQRHAVNAYFDKLEHNMKRQCRKVHEDKKTHIDEVIKQNKKLLENLDQINAEMTTKEQNDNKCQVFVRLKQWQDLPTEFTRKLEEIRVSSRVNNYRFESTDYLKVHDSKYFGNLRLLPEHIDVKQGRETTCDIRKLAILTNGTIVLADYKNDSVKIMHPGRLQVSPELRYNISSPVGLAILSVNQFAVSTYDGKIQVIEMSSSKLTFVNELYPSTFDKIITNSLCNTNNGLIVAEGSHFYEYPRETKFEIVSCARSVFASIFFKTTQDNWSAQHECFATCSRNETIFRTQKHPWISGLSKVFHQTMNGTILNTYANEQLPSPCGVGVSSNGTVYVCDDETNTIHVLSQDLNLRRIWKVDFGEAKPRGLAICDKFEMVYVCTDGDFICVLRQPALL